MSKKRPTKKAIDQALAETGAALDSSSESHSKCCHQLCEPLLAALKKMGIKLIGDGAPGHRKYKKAYQVLHRDLGEIAYAKQSAPLDEEKVKTLQPYFDALNTCREKGQFPQAEYENLLRLRDGLLPSESDAVSSYLSHVETRIRGVARDAVRLRYALEAKARCLEFEARWLEAVPVLQEIITIEEDRLFDPVEGARTRSRTAQAYNRDWKKESFANAKTLLIEGRGKIEHIKTVLRTKLELMLTLAHAHIGLDEHLQCLDILAECEPLLKKLREQKTGDSYVALGADYDVRMGVAMKRRGTDIPGAHKHLVAGALARAKIQNLIGTAHAVRHLGGLYAEGGPGWVNRRDALKRSLWFYIAALEIFKLHDREDAQVARAHLNCGNVLKYLWQESPATIPTQEKNELTSFQNGIGSSLRDDENGEIRSLFVEIGKIAGVPSTGVFAYSQSFASGALAHYRRSLELKEKIGIDDEYVPKTKGFIEQIESGKRPQMTAKSAKPQK